MNDMDKRDAALSVLHRYRQGHAGLAEDALAELTAILVPKAETERLRAALEPFAEVGQWLFASAAPDDAPAVEFNGINGHKIVWTRGHLKAAHTALHDAPQQFAVRSDGNG